MKSRIKGLVIARRQGEFVRLNFGKEEILIEVVEVRGRFVRLAFKASEDVVIRRTQNPCAAESDVQEEDT